MIKKILLIYLSIFFIAVGTLGIVTGIYFMTPSLKAQSSIQLPEQVEDPASSSPSSTTEFKDEGYDNIYVADVHQSLTLRSEPDSNSSPVMDEGLAPLTKMQVEEFVPGTNFAYVTVINGNHQGLTGYVNCDYITRLGEPTVRVNAD